MMQTTEISKGLKTLAIAQMIFLACIAVSNLHVLAGLAFYSVGTFMSIYAFYKLFSVGRNYKIAFFLYTAKLVIRLVELFFLPFVLSVAECALDCLIVCFVCKATVELLKGIEQTALAASASRVIATCIAGTVLSVLVSLLSVVWDWNAFLVVLNIFSTVFLLVGTVLHIIFLGESSSQLNKMIIMH